MLLLFCHSSQAAKWKSKLLLPASIAVNCDNNLQHMCQNNNLWSRISTQNLHNHAAKHHYIQLCQSLDTSLLPNLDRE